MNNFGWSKTNNTAQYPVHASDTSGLVQRSEPMLTPEQLVSRFLKGIPLVFPNGDSFSPEELKDRIYLATNEVEVLTQVTVNREAFRETMPFDASLFRNYIHTRTERGPIISVEKLSITSASGQDIYVIPPDWIATGNFSKRLLHVIPLLGANSFSQSGTGQGSNVGGLAFLSVLAGTDQIPQFWACQFTAGVSNQEGKIPTIFNELIGTVAAMAILSEIAPNNLWNSQSLSMDGNSQSSSGPGTRIYVQRIEDLEKKKEELVKKIKGIFSNKFFIGNI